MQSFWEKINSVVQNQDYKSSWNELQKEASFRPTLYIGVGGLGCSVVRKLKQEIEKLIPDQGIRDGFAFLGLDTHPREKTEILSNNEYIEMIGFRPGEAAKDPHYRKYLDWYTKLCGKWSTTTTIGTGAGKVKATGRIAFLFPPTLQKFQSSLNAAFMKINQFRTSFSPNTLPKVYIISSLAGGTGSGIVLDLIILVKEYFFKNVDPKFNKLQGILVTPEALEGEARQGDFPDFYANTYATLKEIFNFIRGNNELVIYNDGNEKRVNVKSDHLPDPLYILTDRNSRSIVKNFDPELSSMIVSYLLFEIQTPITDTGGQPKPQDKENPDYNTLGHGEMPKSFSSIGTVRFGFPYDKIQDLYTLKIISKALEDELKEEECLDTVNIWIHENNLAEYESDQLQDTLRKDKQNQAIRITIDTQGELSEVKRVELENACSKLVTVKHRAVDEQFRSIIEKNSTRIIDNAKISLEKKFIDILNTKSTSTAILFLKRVEEELNRHKKSLAEELSISKERFGIAEKKLKQSLGNVASAAKSSIFGRKARLNSAISALDADLETYLNQQIIVWTQEQAHKVYEEIISFCKDLINKWIKIKESLQSRLDSIHNQAFSISKQIDKLADINQRGEGNRFSLVNSLRAIKIYDSYIGEEIENGIVNRVISKWKEQGILYNFNYSDSVWISNVKNEIEAELSEYLKKLNIKSILDIFYKDENERKLLFETLVALGSPLYPVNTQFAETNYDTSWVVAVHPDLRDDFLRIFSNYRPVGEAMLHAYFASPYEIILYNITHGYTAHSLSTINTYKAYYDNLEGRYKDCVSRGIAHRPIHCWPNASSWEDVVPKPPTDDEAIKLFIVGRAFNYLYPSAVTGDGKPDEKKNTSYIYARGSNYYLIVEDGKKPVKIGNGLDEAVENFKDHPEWQSKVKEMVDVKISEVGKSTIRTRLEQEYLPILDEEIGTSERSNEQTRLEILMELKRMLKNFINHELIERRV